MIRLFASILLALSLLLMPIAMTGHDASAMEPAAASASSCPDHHEPTAPNAPAHKGMAHCMVCIALPQPGLCLAPHVSVMTGTGDAMAMPQLEGITPTVSDPPPKIA